MAERAKAKVTEVAGSHSVYVSKPREVAEIIAVASAKVTDLGHCFARF